MLSTALLGYRPRIIKRKRKTFYPAGSSVSSSASTTAILALAALTALLFHLPASPPSCVVDIFTSVPVVDALALGAHLSPRRLVSCFRRETYDYDLVVIGAGASGMFAAGTAAGFGCRTLLIDLAMGPTTGHGGEEAGGRPVGGRGGGAVVEEVSSPPEEFVVGGDCTNAACVPSKAVRSAARLAAAASRSGSRSSLSRPLVDGDGAPPEGVGSGSRWLALARSHADAAVSSVRDRESPTRIASSRNLDLEFVSGCRFVSRHRLNLTSYDNSTWLEGGDDDCDGSDGAAGTNAERGTTSRVVTARRFLVAVGASPVVPPRLAEAAERCGVPWHTYRTALRPASSSSSPSSGAPPVEGGGSLWSLLLDDARRDTTSGDTAAAAADAAPRRKPHVVVAGGGAAAVELSQSLARLGGREWDVTVVAPSILPSEDVALRRAAVKLLTDDGVRIVLGRRVADVMVCAEEKSGGVDEGRGAESEEGGGTSGAAAAEVVLDDNSTLPVSSLLLCLGRSPDESLAALNLTATGATFATPGAGVDVNTYLRSLSASHVYACGDCASAVPHRDRRAAHAGWTGFHAAKNALMPASLSFLRSPAVHENVPRVVYTDPELGGAGMTEEECVREYGAAASAAASGGYYSSLSARERGTDRADQESVERSPDVGFVSLRATTVGGKILGGSAAGPAAAELANELCLCRGAGLTVRDLARAVHSYPSHGYLLYRVALAMATGSISGLLAGCGGAGRVLAAAVRGAERAARSIRRPGGALLWTRRAGKRRSEWEAEGCGKVLILGAGDGSAAGVASHSADGSSALLTEGFASHGEESMFSFLEVHQNKTLRASVLDGIQGKDGEIDAMFGGDDFVHWCSKEPI